MHTMAPIVKTTSKAIRCFRAICRRRSSGTGTDRTSRSRAVLRVDVTNMKRGRLRQWLESRRLGGCQDREMGMHARTPPRKRVSPKMAMSRRRSRERCRNGRDDQMRRYEVTMDILMSAEERPQRGGEIQRVWVVM